jgi:hypothetical protein
MSMLVALVVLQFGQPSCMDFTGHYVISGEDGAVDVRITQLRCASVDVNWESSLYPRKPVVHTVRLDGVARADSSWFGDGRILSAASITTNRLTFEFTYDVGGTRSLRKRSLALELLSTGDLCVTDQNTSRTQPPHIARRRTPWLHSANDTGLRSPDTCS